MLIFKCVDIHQNPILSNVKKEKLEYYYVKNLFECSQLNKFFF